MQNLKGFISISSFSIKMFSDKNEYDVQNEQDTECGWKYIKKKL